LNALEKILARASGRKQVTVGEIVDAVVDRLMITERQGARVVDNLKELGMPQIRMPREKVIVVFDHEVPPSKIVSANAQRRVRECFAGQTILYDMNVGICHQVLSEKGHVEPGLLVVGSDSHTVTNGAFGAFATGIGITEATGVLLTGTIWLKIPPVMAVPTINVVTDAYEAAVMVLKSAVIKKINLFDIGAIASSNHSEQRSPSSIGRRTKHVFATSHRCRDAGGSVGYSVVAPEKCAVFCRDTDQSFVGQLDVLARARSFNHDDRGVASLVFSSWADIGRGTLPDKFSGFPIQSDHNRAATARRTQ